MKIEIIALLAAMAVGAWTVVWAAEQTDAAMAECQKTYTYDTCIRSISR